jgi:hypothetical protein
MAMFITWLLVLKALPAFKVSARFCGIEFFVSYLLFLDNILANHNAD